jgi:hypothetical protein
MAKLAIFALVLGLGYLMYVQMTETYSRPKGPGLPAQSPLQSPTQPTQSPGPSTTGPAQAPGQSTGPTQSPAQSDVGGGIDH